MTDGLGTGKNRDAMFTRSFGKNFQEICNLLFELMRMRGFLKAGNLDEGINGTDFLQGFQ